MTKKLLPVLQASATTSAAESTNPAALLHLHTEDAADEDAAEVEEVAG
jgi:hypothetical protein